MLTTSRINLIDHNKIVNTLLVLISFAFPFDVLISSYLIALLFLVVVILRLNKKVIFHSPHFYFYIFISLYLINIVGLIYTNDLSIGLKSLETKASLLIFPIIFIALKELKVNINAILRSFVYGVLLATLICLAYAFWRQFNFNHFTAINWFFFSYRDLTSILDIHPIYLAFYVSFAGMIVLFYGVQSYEENNMANLAKYIFMYFYLFIMLFLLSSRINIAGHLLLTFLLLIYIAYKTKKWQILLIWGLTIFVFIFVLLNNFKIAKERIYEALSINQQTEYIQQWGDTTVNSLDIRLIKWGAALDIIKYNWLIGVGTGDGQMELNKAYIDYDFREGIDRKFNVHNIYLQNLMTFGIPGFVLLLLNIILPFSRSITQENIIYFSFLFLFLFFGLTESVFEVQKGVVAFSFFNGLFFFCNNPKIGFKLN